MALSIKTQLLRACNAVVDLIYPPLCLYCEAKLPPTSPLFCERCLEFLRPLPMEGHCMRCFDELGKHTACQRCRMRPVMIHRQAAVTAAFGPAKTLLSRLERSEFHLIQAVASLILLQFAQLGWAVPDAIVPVPIPWWQRLKRGQDVNLLLARELAASLERPILRPFVSGIDWGKFGSADGLQQKYTIKMRAKEALCDQRLLLISLNFDDALFRESGEALQEGFPAEINALGFAKYE